MEKEKDFIGMQSDSEEELLLSNFQKPGMSRMRMLAGLYRGNYWRLFASTACFIVKHAYAWVLPILTADIIDTVTEGSPDTPRVLIIDLCIMALLVLVNVPFNYLYTKFISSATRSVEAGLRSTMVAKLQRLSISFHHKMQSGRLQSKIMRDVEAVEGLSTQLFSSLINIALDLGVALAVTLRRSPVVFFFFLLSVPVAMVLIVASRRKMRSRNNEFRVATEETSAQVMEMMELVPVTRAHALEDWELSRMRRTVTNAANTGFRLDITHSLFGAITYVTFQIFQVFCLVFTAWLAYRKIISVGDVVLYQSYFATVIGQVSSLTSLLPAIAKGFESINSVSDILQNDDEERYAGKRVLEDLHGDVDFDHVSFTYDGKRQILDGFDLHVKAGETVAFVGESGAGKTTLLNLVIGFYQAQEGCVRVDGVDIRELDMHTMRSRLAVVPQNSVLFSGTIRENITYGLENVSEERLLAAVEAANLTELIEELPLGLNTYVTEHGSNLSGGQRQRISIARAIIRDPRVIVLDEATSALDSISEQKIQSAIGNLTRGRTTFIVAHRLSTIRNADRIAVVQDGRCVECGGYDELMAQKGEFYRFKQLQS